MNDRKNQKPAPTAAEAYAAHRSDIARLIDVLEMELDKSADKAAADPKNWGYAGNLQKLRNDLVYAVVFMSGLERENVEDFLNDAE